MIVNAQIHAKSNNYEYIKNQKRFNRPKLFDVGEKQLHGVVFKMKVSMQIQEVWVFVIPNDPKVAVEVRTDKIAMTTIFKVSQKITSVSCLEEIRERNPGCDQNDVHGSKLSEERKSANIES